MSCKRGKHEETLSKELLDIILKEIKNSKESSCDSMAVDSSDSEDETIHKDEIVMPEPAKKLPSETISPLESIKSISQINDSNFYQNNWFTNKNQNKFSTPGEIRAMVKSVGYQNSMLTSNSAYAKENIRTFDYPRSNNKDKKLKTSYLEDVIFKLDKCSGKVKKENNTVSPGVETLKNLTRALKYKSNRGSKTENSTNLSLVQEKEVNKQNEEKSVASKMTQSSGNSFENKNFLNNCCKPEKGDSMSSPASRDNVQPCIVVSLKEILENFHEKSEKQTQTNVGPIKLSKACAAESRELRLSMNNNMLFPTAKTMSQEGEKKASKRRYRKSIRQPAGLASVVWSFVTGASMTNILYEDKPLSVCSSRNKCS